VLFTKSAFSQTIFTENNGTPSGTTTISSNTFQNGSVLTFSNGGQANSADIRITSPSTNYSNASGGGNVFFSSTSGNYGFSIEGIQASNYNSLSLQFGYRKESASVQASFSVDYWNGSVWATLGNTSSNTIFNESTTATATWYLSKTLVLPSDAQINGLKIRFIKTGTNSIRIDDIKLSGIETLPTVTNSAISNVTNNSATFNGTVLATGGSNIVSTGTVYAITTVNSNPTIGSSGVTTVSTPVPNSGTGVFTNNSGTVLSANEHYSYNAFAIKSTGAIGYGLASDFYTLAETPSSPIVNAPTATKLNVTIGSDNNSSYTTYAIQESNTGYYVQGDGTLAGTIFFQDKTTWSTKTVVGLSSNTTYTFRVIAKNGNNINTSFSNSVNATTLSPPSVNYIGSLTALNTIYGSASSTISFSVSATNLTDNLTITAPNGFEVSQTSGGLTGYSNSLVVNQNSGVINSTVIYVRLAASSSFGSYSGNISLTSINDGVTVNVPTVTSTITKVNVTLMGISALDKVYDGGTVATLNGTGTLNGILASDVYSVTLNTTNASANFLDASIGTNKQVTVNGYSLVGLNASNYNLIQPTGIVANITPNAISDIVFNSSSPTSSNTNINYTLYQGSTLTSTGTGINGSVGVMGFYLRDGGGQIDADNLGTELTDITFNITNSANIKAARLFVGNSARGTAVLVNGGSSVTFSGLTNIVAADNDQLAVNLRVTFNSNVTDNQQIQFTIVSATSNSAGSRFAQSNAGGASSSISGDVNRIEVTADNLSFVQQPSNTYINNIMNPFPSVEARDSNGNRDLDFSGALSLTSTGTLYSTTIVSNATNGLVQFNNVNHTAIGSGIVLTASSSGFASVNSNSFDVNSLIVPTFYSVAPICAGSVLNNLPTTSVNGITGSWSPAINNLSTTTYTFTPNVGQNASSTTLTIVVNSLITPTFNSVAPVPAGSLIPSLPTVSNNSIVGSWSPAIDNSVTTTYTFTPSSGLCATTTTLTIIVIPSIVGSSNSTIINSIHQIDYKIATTTSSTTHAPNEVVEKVMYFDGLGRAIQQKILKQSNTGKDIVTPIEYDIFGRQPKKYLPYVTSATSPDYEANALTDVALYYTNLGSNFESTSYPFSQTDFDNSPLNRITKVSSPGDDWRINTTSADNTKKIEYQINSANEVRLFSAISDSNNNTISLSDGGFYPANELTKTIVKNENWKVSDGTDNTTEEFQDKEGRIVLRRTYGTSVVNGNSVNENHDTYYVYDQFSNLTYVFTPKVNVLTTPSVTVIDNLCYQYKYDSRNRLVEKKVPGKDWEFMVYDKLDRIVASGPAFSPFNDATGANNNGWNVIKYDVYNRVITSGWMQSNSVASADRINLQNTLNSATTFNETKVGANYTNTVWPTSNYTQLSINYYDDYNSNVSFTQTMTFQADGYNNSTNLPKGLPTISWVRIPESSSSATIKEEKSFIIYDKKARPAISFTNNHLNGYTKVTKQMQPITGRVDQTVLKHKRSSSSSDVEITVTNAFTYTNQDRLITNTHQIGSGVPQLMGKYEYSELGQLISKRVGSKTPGDIADGLQKVDYSYNSRGWLKAINNIDNLVQGSDPRDLFAFKINYNTVDNSSTTKQYNGNISEILWRTASDDIVKQYSYDYDELGRMTNAVFSKPIAGTTPLPTNSYGENVLYDKNGNITHLDRYTDGTAPTNHIDELDYSYYADSNQLKSVTDQQANPQGFNDGNVSGDDYSYDNLGNLIIDKNKGIVDPSSPAQAAISYNQLNLPKKIAFGSNGTIEYLYDGTGKKIQKLVTQGPSITTTEYLDGFQYTTSNTSPTTLDFFPTAEGYVKNTAGVYSYVFNYTDHLGNVRLSYCDVNGDGVLTNTEILDENNYYPFGLKHSGYNYYPPTGNNYKYNGKELQEELGLNLTAMDFRQYDNTLGRFNVIDPLTDEDYGISPYAFAGNNPILFGDPSGLKYAAAESIENFIPQGGAAAMFASGMNGLKVRDQLLEQAWGPGFHVRGGGGGVDLLKTNYKTGERGYWTVVVGRVYGRGQGYDFYDLDRKIDGVSNQEVVIELAKKWIIVGPTLWDGIKDGLKLVLQQVEDRTSGYIEYGGRMTDSFIGGMKGLKGCIYGVIENLWSPSFGVSINNAKIPEIPKNIGETVEGLNLGYETANSFYEEKETATTVKDSMFYVIDPKDGSQYLANNPSARDSLLLVLHSKKYNYTP